MPMTESVRKAREAFKAQRSKERAIEGGLVLIIFVPVFAATVWLVVKMLTLVVPFWAALGIAIGMVFVALAIVLKD